MSFSVLLSQNKILAYFILDSSSNIQQSQLLQPSVYPTMVYHNHYPIIYYDQLYKHFQHCLPENTTPGNLRIYLNNKEQIPSQLPLGLYIDTSPVYLTVRIDLSVTLPQSFRVIKNTWKKAFEVVNQNRRCDYVKTRLSQPQLKEKFQMYVRGDGHNLQREGLYEGTHMLVKGLFEGVLIERKYRMTMYQNLHDIVENLFGLDHKDMEKIKQGKLRVKSHNINVNLELNSKLFLDEWSYNDGYCYLKLQVGEQSVQKMQYE